RLLTPAGAPCPGLGAPARAGGGEHRVSQCLGRPAVARRRAARLRTLHGRRRGGGHQLFPWLRVRAGQCTPVRVRAHLLPQQQDPRPDANGGRRAAPVRSACHRRPRAGPGARPATRSWHRRADPGRAAAFQPLPRPRARRMSHVPPPTHGPGDIVRAGLCIGCGACAGLAPAGRAAMGFDRHGLLRPLADPGWMRTGPPGFAALCPFSPGADDEDTLAAAAFPEAPFHAASVGRYESAWVGHAAEGDFRLQGSSGGLVSWVACEPLDKGLVDAVVHVAPCAEPRREGRFFAYRISRSRDQVRAGAQSRYHPIEFSEVLRAIAAQPGRYAVVGIPCFIKAVQLLRRREPLYRERIAYTLGLFCGHMKSARFTESLAMQMGLPLQRVRGVEYRHKAEDRPANWYSSRMTLDDGSRPTRDWWHLADGDWGAGFFMAPACNFCDDVVAETADVSFGDAWVEPHASDWRGTNVM